MSTQTASKIDTKKVTGRRTLSFSTFDAVLADAEKIGAADRAGRVRRLGNWTPGMILTHIAAFASFPYDGYPEVLAHPPWFIKFILKRMKNRYIHKALPAGVHIPKVPGGTVGMDDVPTEEGLRRLRGALERMKRMPPSTPNVIFGPLTSEEWMALQCRHAELHFSFLVF